MKEDTPITTRHKIIIGDSRDMSEVTDESIQLIITSPPYWQLKDYGGDAQIGFDDSYEDYINNLNLVWKECHRVLEPGCRLCVNIGDQFARSVYYGRYKVIPIRTEIIRFCETIGFDYMGAVIWQKVTTCNTTGGATIMGSYPYPRNGILKIDYEFILIFKKHGKAKQVPKEIKEKSKMTKKEWNEFFTGHWNFSGEKQDKHIAMFPVELPRRLIKMFSYVGDTVIDPFLGSGTTTLAAKTLERNSIGYEVNAEYLPVIKDKIGYSERRLFTKAEFEFIKRAHNLPLAKRLSDLPYLFKDPLKFEKKVDPRKMKFGSVIENGDNGEKEEFRKVSEVISPEMVKLDNGLVVKLIGVKSIPTLRAEAEQFLRDKTKAQNVFLKFDSVKYDDENNLLCYLYLRNKTLLNAHLIKAGLAKADNTLDYKYRNKFTTMGVSHE